MQGWRAPAGRVSVEPCMEVGAVRSCRPAHGMQVLMTRSMREKVLGGGPRAQHSAALVRVRMPEGLLLQVCSHERMDAAPAGTHAQRMGLPSSGCDYRRKDGHLPADLLLRSELTLSQLALQPCMRRDAGWPAGQLQRPRALLGHCRLDEHVPGRHGGASLVGALQLVCSTAWQDHAGDAQCVCCWPAPAALLEAVRFGKQVPGQTAADSMSARTTRLVSTC